MNVRAERFQLVDSLRAIAAVSVVAFHASFFSGLFDGTSFARYYVIQLGSAGVTLFFVISGFLLYRPFVRARLDGVDRPRTAAYAWRRFLRIVPAFWVTLTVVAIWLGPHPWSPRELLSNYGFLQLYIGDNSYDVLQQAWTLGVEVCFYVTLPLWAWAMYRLRAADDRARVRQELFALGGLVAVGIAYLAVTLHLQARNAVISALPGYFDLFGFGMLLAVVSVWSSRQGGRLPAPLELLARRPWLCVLLALAALQVDAWAVGLDRPSADQRLLQHVLHGVAAVMVMIPAVFGAAGEGRTRRVLGNRALAFVGLVSYSVYLTHWAVVEQLVRWNGGPGEFRPRFVLWFPVALAATVVTGALGYYLVERPALKFKKLVPRRRGEPRDEALAEPTPVLPATAPPAG
jgi:peptidoglycan/LPS O-acetylase OafA/YrhL